MRFEILGPVAAFRGEEDVTPRGSLQRRLLAALLVRAPDPVEVDTLAEVLWPDGAPSPNALQAQVSKLRRVVAPVSIDSGATGYSLAVTAGSVDRDHLEAGLERAARASAGDASVAGAQLEELHRTIRGEPLPELADTDFARAERARLALLIETLDARRLEAKVDGDDSAAAIAELEALVDARPLDEHLWALLMRAQYRLGRQGDALRTYQRARQMLAAELGVEPGPELTATQRLVLDQHTDLDPSRRPRQRRARLPAPMSSFVGRTEVLASVREHLTTSRLITLLGPGGVGKTTTALQALREHPAPVDMVELAPLLAEDRDDVLTAILGALGQLDTQPNATRDELMLGQRVVDALGDEPSVLLIDNCEHVVGAAAKVVHELLEACPALRVVATSRESLGVPGEHVLAVPPMAEEAGVELFVQRALAAGGEVDVDADREVIAELVVRLDGLPLAIELAAARTRSLTPSQLRDRLDDRFAVLTSGQRTVDQRQQTLRDVVDWSHALLDASEQAVFRRLSAFEGGASLEAAEDVCADDDLVDPPAVVGLLERLIDKSLVVTDRRSDVVRYRMLETIQSFARERLGASGERESTLLRHARHFATELEPVERGLMGPEQRRWMDAIAAERENLRAALEVAVACGDSGLALRLTAPLGWYAYMTGQFEIGAQLLDDALGCPGRSPARDRALALAMYGWLLANGSDMERAGRAADDAVLMLPEVDDGWVETLVIACWMMVSFLSGGVEVARRAFDGARDAAGRSGDEWSAALVDLTCGEILHAAGETDDAAEAFTTAATGFHAVGDRFMYSICLGEAASVAELRGHYDSAANILARAVAAALDSGLSSHPVALRANLANIEILRGDLDRAEQMHHEVIEALDGQPFQWMRVISWTGLAMIARRRGDPDAAERWLVPAWELRRTQTVPHMQAYVLAARGYTADQRGEGASALALQRRALDLQVEVGNPRGVAYALEGVAGAIAVLDDDGPLALGARLLGRADGLRRATGGAMPSAERFDVDRAERRLRGRLGDEAFDLHSRDGSTSSTDELVAAVRSLDLP